MIGVTGCGKRDWFFAWQDDTHNGVLWFSQPSHLVRSITVAIGCPAAALADAAPLAMTTAPAAPAAAVRRKKDRREILSTQLTFFHHTSMPPLPGEGCFDYMTPVYICPAFSGKK